MNRLGANLKDGTSPLRPCWEEMLDELKLGNNSKSAVAADIGLDMITRLGCIGFRNGGGGGECKHDVR